MNFTNGLVQETPSRPATWQRYIGTLARAARNTCSTKRLDVARHIPATTLRIIGMAAILLVVVNPSGAQNLLGNPGFDDLDQLTWWTCSQSNGQPLWHLDDRLGSVTSGSLEQNVTAELGNTRSTCSQCVPIDEQSTYAVSAWYFWPDDGDVSQLGSSRLSIQFFSDGACMTSLPGSETAVGFPGSLDTWLYLESDGITAPAGAASARVDVLTWQNVGNQHVRARYDDVVFSLAPVFRDDFETGGLGMWSASVP